MDHWDSHCPYLLRGEPTAKGTGLAKSAGKEDPVELDSSHLLLSVDWGVALGGRFFEHAKPLLSATFNLFRKIGHS